MHDEIKSFANKTTGSNINQQINELKQRSESVYRLILYFDIIAILYFFSVAFTELNLGYQVYSKYLDIDQTYYYSMIKSYLSYSDSMIELSYNESEYNRKCTNTTTAYDGIFKFNQIKNFVGICVSKKKNITNNSSYYELDFSGNYTEKCEFTNILISKPLVINDFFEGKLCYKKQPYNYNNYYFSKSNCSFRNYNLCGSYGGYNLCFIKEKCPIFFFTLNESNVATSPENNFTFLLKDHPILPNIYKTNKVSLNNHYIFFMIKFQYINTIYSSNEDDLKRNYIDFYSNNTIDFSLINTNTNKSFYSVIEGFPLTFSSENVINNNLELIKQNSNLDRNLDIKIKNYPPNNFSLIYKSIPFPESKCLDYFNDKYYLEIMNNLYIFFLSTTMPKYFTWVIVELIFIIIFYLYLKGYIIYKELKRIKINHNDKISTAVSNNTILIFHLFLLFLKCFFLMYSLIKIKKRIEVTKFIYEKECFDDIAFTISVKLLNQDLNIIYEKIRICLLINLTSFIIICLKFFIFLYYYYSLNRKIEELKSKKNKNL